MNELAQGYITSIGLKNYKSIQHLEISCEPGLNIIIGQNGSGKTTFAELLSILFCEARHHELPMGFAFQLAFKTPLNDWIKWSGQVNLEKKHQKSPNTYQSKVQSKTQATQTDRLMNDTFFEFFDVHQAVSLLDYTLIPFGLNPKLSFLNQLGTIKITVLEDKIDLFAMEATGLFPDDFIESIELNKERKATVKEIKKNFRIKQALVTHLADFTPIQQCRISDGLSIQRVANDFFIHHVALEFFVKDRWYSWEQLSDGTKRLFYIFAKTLSSKGLVMVEEPELGLHPDQLFKLMDFLKEQSEYKQMMITTHAPDVLNILKKNELNRIIVTQFDVKKGTLMHHLSPKKIKKAHKYMDTDGLALKDFWLHSNLEAVEQEA